MAATPLTYATGHLYTGWNKGNLATGGGGQDFDHVITSRVMGEQMTKLVREYGSREGNGRL